MPRELLVRDVWSLFDASLTVGSEGLDRFLSTTLERCAAWFQASGASLFLRDDLTNTYEVAVKAGTDMRVPDGARLMPGVGIAGTCIVRGEPMLIGDPDAHPALAFKVRRKRADIASSLVLPLIAPETGCIGVLNLSRKCGEEPFVQEDLRHAESVAHYVALAVGNAKLINRLNEALGESTALHEKLEAVVSCLGVGVIVVNAQGRIEEVNPEARSLIGWSPDDGMEWEGYIANASKALAGPLQESFEAALEGRRAPRRAYDPDTQRAWSIIATPMPSGGAAVSIEDVSEYDQTLKELDRVRRLAEIGQMTAAIAHEIRNPLASIRGSAQMVRQSEEHVKEFANIIEEEAMKLNSLCDDFLDFARPLELRESRIRLNELASQLIDQHQKEFDDANVRLSLEISAQEPKIWGDPFRLEQAVRNLLLNALQACEPGGTVELTVGNGWLSVEDDGCGMTEEQQSKLFTPFFTTKPKGTGLGLSNVRKVIDAHGGSIEVKSTEGSGTRFTIQLKPRGDR
ncbi:MAG: GAF domain-containing protein [Fimbriimonadaceae bacterium]|nr:GAF domain-containing protein [Fimbriimonadaceae bacterium]